PPASPACSPPVTSPTPGTGRPSRPPRPVAPRLSTPSAGCSPAARSRRPPRRKPMLVGKQAPDFRMTTTKDLDTLEHEASLVDYKGRWLVLFFYPADFTFVCPTE